MTTSRETDRPRPQSVTSTGAAADVWFQVHRRARPPRLRLLCLPHAGGAATFFQGWPRLLPDDVEVLAVRYPGRQSRLLDPFAPDLPTLAADIHAALDPYLDRPLALFGHSMGSAVAYEIALRLEDRGHAPTRLLASGRVAPHRAAPSDRHTRDDEALIDAVRRHGGPGVSVYEDPELRELTLPALRADYRLIETYLPRDPRPLRTPITAYAGATDPDCTPAGVHAWSELTAPGRFDHRWFPGGHFYLTPSEPELLADIATRLG
ncbi:thioesterase II family protein [Kitasatospora sp. CB01950]|uniref:thioesterase II family protein n=1 Tax=Kitasatospora sp. CB01950 TaxID=1703930 RepID=UPI0009FAD8B1|nr:alpha/beta fold hydrolase [Kitasatospora sp. CB01950]